MIKWYVLLYLIGFYSIIFVLPIVREPDKNLTGNTFTLMAITVVMFTVVMQVKYRIDKKNKSSLQ